MPWAQCPLIAILRGLEPKNAEPVAQFIIDAGLRIVEVPLNSPDPLASISSIVKRHGGRTIVGAGTVLTVADVEALRTPAAKYIHDAGLRVKNSLNITKGTMKRA